MTNAELIAYVRRTPKPRLGADDGWPEVIAELADRLERAEAERDVANMFADGDSSALRKAFNATRRAEAAEAGKENE